MQKIQIERTTAPKAKPADESKLGFGKIFTDHMYVMEYNPEQGWHDPKIMPYQLIRPLWFSTTVRKCSRA